MSDYLIGTLVTAGIFVIPMAFIMWSWWIQLKTNERLKREIATLKKKQKEMNLTNDHSRADAGEPSEQERETKKDV